MKLTLLGAIATAAVLTQAASAAYEPKPGEGVLCMAALTSVANEVGRRCYPNKHPALQAELARSVEKFDAYMLANGVTPVALKVFKTQQGAVEAPVSKICQGDAATLYESFAEPSAMDELKKSVAELTRRPGQPRWGDCL